MSITRAAPKTARELAKWLIWPYVARGDSIEELREGGMGYGGREGVVEIHLDHIVVRQLGKPSSDINDWTVKARFSLRELYREIQAEACAGAMQASLFGEEGEAAP